MFVAAVYLVLCLAVALAGRRRRIGFSGYFILSIVFTPLVMLIFLILSRWDRKRKPRKHTDICSHCEQEIRAMSEVRHCFHCGRSM